MPKAEAMLKNKQSVFMKEYRSRGIPATKVPDGVVQPMVEKVMSMPDEQLLNIGEVVAHPRQQRPHSFDSFICADCGEMVVDQYGRIRGDDKVCIICLGCDVA